MIARSWVATRSRAISAERISDFWRRSREVVGLCAVVGGVTGVLVAAFERLSISAVFDRLSGLPLWARALAPLCGLTVAALVLRAGGGVSPSTSDEYIRNYHLPDDLDLRPWGPRLLAAVATIASGCPGGLEGPSIYLGAGVGTAVQARLRGVLGSDATKNLMVAGAAAGVAAVFKAPATGAVFALEVPYKDDLGRHQLMPALVGAATGYLAFVAVNGTAPLFSVGGATPFDFRDLIGALILGLGTGVVIRGFAAALRGAKRIQQQAPKAAAIPAVGALLAGSVFLSQRVYGRDLALSTGYDAVKWATRPSHSLALVALLLVIRCAGVVGSVAGGGVIGLFVPLVVAGAIFGRFVGGAIGVPNLDLFIIVGISAALGAGYRVPLAAVMFVAEATGRPGFVVPALLAAVAGDLAMGTASVTAYQSSSGHVDDYH